MKSLPSSVIRTETSLVRSRLPLPQLPRTWDAERSSALSSRPVTLFPPKTSGPPAGSTATVSQPLPTAVVGKTRPGTPGKGISLGAKYGSGTASDGKCISLAFAGNGIMPGGTGAPSTTLAPLGTLTNLGNSAPLGTLITTPGSLATLALTPRGGRTIFGTPILGWAPNIQSLATDSAARPSSQVAE